MWKKILMGFLSVFIVLPWLLAVIAFNVVIDTGLVAKNRTFSHARHALLEGVLCVVVALGSLWVVYHTTGIRYSWTSALYPLGIYPSLRWILHDWAMNYARDLPWNYYGTGENQAFTDRILEKYGSTPARFILIKGSFFIISLILTWTI